MMLGRRSRLGLVADTTAESLAKVTDGTPELDYELMKTIVFAAPGSRQHYVQKKIEALITHSRTNLSGQATRVRIAYTFQVDGGAESAKILLGTELKDDTNTVACEELASVGTAVQSTFERAFGEGLGVTFRIYMRNEPPGGPTGTVSSYCVRDVVVSYVMLERIYRRRSA